MWCAQSAIPFGESSFAIIGSISWLWKYVTSWTILSLRTPIFLSVKWIVRSDSLRLCLFLYDFFLNLVSQCHLPFVQPSWSVYVHIVAAHRPYPKSVFFRHLYIHCSPPSSDFGALDTSPTAVWPLFGHQNPIVAITGGV